jgi:nucleotide-binding universal stress UspA family protein
MFKKILYPTDFSDVSKKAMEYIKQLKEAGAEEVVLLHVLDDRAIPAMVGPDDGAQVSTAQLEKMLGVMEVTAKEEAEAAGAELKQAGFDVSIRVVRGMPFRDILRVEEEEDVSVIVIGSHGTGLVKEMILGSVSEKVIRKSIRPVLVVKG